MVYSQLGFAPIFCFGRKVYGRAHMSATVKFILGGVVIVAAMFTLGYVSCQEGKAYYITVAEYDAMKGSLAGKTLKLAGDVVAGSIDRSKPQMEFVISSGNHKIKVLYTGKEIIPDTFKDGSIAVVEGKPAADGSFHANHIEAKCSSKYESKYDKRTSK